MQFITCLMPALPASVIQGSADYLRLRSSETSDTYEGPNFSPEKCLKEYHILDSVRKQFWSTLFLFEMDQNCSFEQFESGPKVLFQRQKTLFLFKISDRVSIWSTLKLFEIAILVHFEQKLGGSKLNFLKHFSGPKFGPRCNSDT